MSHGKNKYQSRESRALVREILMREWDPIGVEGISGAENEYDGYAGIVYVMLVDEQATTKTMADFLLKSATVDMGLAPSSDIALRCTRAAQILTEVRPQLEVH